MERIESNPSYYTALLGRNTILNVVFRILKIKYELYNTGLPKKDKTSATTLYKVYFLVFMIPCNYKLVIFE